MTLDRIIATRRRLWAAKRMAVLAGAKRPCCYYPAPLAWLTKGVK